MNFFTYAVIAIVIVKKTINAQCPEDEVAVDCKSPCGPTCTEVQPNLCRQNCKFRCECDAPLVRNERNGLCIDKELCHSGECGKHQEYLTGGCIRTCRNPKPDFCASAHLNGCFCKYGYLLNEKSNECVHTRNCPK